MKINLPRFSDGQRKGRAGIAPRNATQEDLLQMFSIYDAQIPGKPNSIVAITVEAQAIFAELVGSNTCTAAGVTVVDHAPVLALCRALVTAGQDPNRPLHAYRGGALCLRVRSIGQAAQLTVEDDRHGRPRLRRWRDRARGCGAAPPAHRRCER